MKKLFFIMCITLVLLTTGIVYSENDINKLSKKVIILDADMRKGRQYRIFDVSPRPGLSNYLAETEENNEIEKFIYET